MPSVRPNPRGVHRLDDLVEVVGVIADHMHDRAEHLARQPRQRVDLHRHRREERATLVFRAQLDNMAPARVASDVLCVSAQHVA